jgi:hypothetical protein
LAGPLLEGSAAETGVRGSRDGRRFRATSSDQAVSLCFPEPAIRAGIADYCGVAIAAGRPPTIYGQLADAMIVVSLP